MRTAKVKKEMLERVTKAIKNRTLTSSGLFFEFNCSDEFKNQPSSKRVYYEGHKVLCKWDDLQMQLFPNNDHTYVCYCGNIVSLSKKERKRI